jgi:anti-sigma-K factor RskA
MDYSQPERADKLAAEYVLGTLRGRARRRFEALLPAHPELRRAVARWHDTLMPLAASLPTINPAAHVFKRLEDRLFERGAAATPPSAAPRRWWQLAAAWRTVAGVATLLLLLVLGLCLAPSANAPPVVVLMARTNGAPSFVASIAGDGHSMVLTPLGGVTVDRGQALELWQLTDQGASRSLGVVSASTPSAIIRKRLLDGTAGFALSLEPQGGSPSGAPSGPLVSGGRLHN